MNTARVFKSLAQEQPLVAGQPLTGPAELAQAKKKKGGTKKEEREKKENEATHAH